MKQEGFNETKELMKKMLDEYKIGKPGTHVGVVEYSDEPTIQLRLDQLFDEEDIKDVIDLMRPSEGETANLSRALEKSVDKMFSFELGGRPSSKKVLIVVAASNTTAKEALKKTSKPLKERGVLIYVIALGDADPEILKELGPKKIKKTKDKNKIKELFKDMFEEVDKDLNSM